MPRLVLFLAIALIALLVYALIDCAMSDRSRVRSIAKPWWILIIIVLPVVGPVLWFVLGRPRRDYTPPPRTRPVGPVAPDDDPEFLRILEQRRRNQAKEAELNAREEQLRKREQGLRKENRDEDPS